VLPPHSGLAFDKTGYTTSQPEDQHLCTPFSHTALILALVNDPMQEQVTFYCFVIQLKIKVEILDEKKV